jgi:hypothetical protein
VTLWTDPLCPTHNGFMGRRVQKASRGYCPWIDGTEDTEDPQSPTHRGFYVLGLPYEGRLSVGGLPRALGVAGARCSPFDHVHHPWPPSRIRYRPPEFRASAGCSVPRLRSLLACRAWDPCTCVGIAFAHRRADAPRRAVRTSLGRAPAEAGFRASTGCSLPRLRSLHACRTEDPCTVAVFFQCVFLCFVIDTRSRCLGRRIHEGVEDTKLSTNKQHSLPGSMGSRARHYVCVECLIGKQKKPILFKVTKPSSIPYRTPSACGPIGIPTALQEH